MYSYIMGFFSQLIFAIVDQTELELNDKLKSHLMPFFVRFRQQHSKSSLGPLVSLVQLT